MTNYEKIMQMSAVELAEAFAEISSWCWCRDCENCPCNKCKGRYCGFTEWLEQEVTDE